MNGKLRIIEWNTNGLVQCKQKLEDLLHDDTIDIVLISEIYFTTCFSKNKKL